MGRIKSVLIVISIWVPLFTSGQNKLELILSAQETKEDFLVLKNSILTYHPDIYLYTSKSKFDSVLVDIESNLGEMSVMDFYRRIYPAIGSIRNKHTNLSLPLQIKKYLSQEAKRIPFSLFYRNDSLYIIKDSSAEYILKEGSIITKINGVKSQDLIREMLVFQSSDGFNKSLPIWNISRNFTTHYAVVYGTPDVFEIEYIDQEKLSKSAKIMAIRRSDFSRNTPKITQPKYEFVILDDLGILTIRTFKIEEEKSYHDFLKNVFNQLAQSNIQRLIIDVRGNLGGYPERSDELLSYLINEKIFPYSKQFALIDKLPPNEHFLENDVFDYFHNERFEKINDTLFVKNAIKHVIKPKKNSYSGKLYFLIDENCASTTSSMLGQAKTHLKTTFIGTETGGNPVSVVANYTVTQKLPHSRIEFKLPLIKSEKNVNFSNYGRGLMPTIKIEPTINEILKENDVVLKKAIEMMKN